MKFLVNENQFKYIISNLKKDLESSILGEGRNEDITKEILKDSNVENPDDLFILLKKVDQSKNNKMLPAIAAFYVNASDQYERDEIITIFEKLFNLVISKGDKIIKIEPPDVSLLSDKKVKIMDQTFSTDNFSDFKDFVEHYYFKEGEEEIENVKLYDVSANKIFENDKFIIYEAPTAQVCIKLFGSDNQDRLYLKRSFCIGGGSLLQPSTMYKNYRSPEGSWGITFYVAVDKEKYKEYLETKVEPQSTLNVIGVRGCCEENYSQKAPFVDNIDENTTISYFVWDESNPGPGYPVRAFGSGEGSVGNYLRYLEENGVNIHRLLKPKKFIEKNDEAINRMAGYQGRDESDLIFKNLSPKQKFIFITTKANTLTPYQVEFLTKKMPEYILKGFISNTELLGDLKFAAFNKLNPNNQKTFISTKLIQLYRDSNKFDKDEFFKYLHTDELKDYAIKKIMANLEKGAVNNKEKVLQILGLLSPEKMLETLKGQETVTINKENLKVSSLPKNFGEYILDAKELVLNDLENLSSIPASIGMAKNLKEITIKNCKSMVKIAAEIGYLADLTYLSISECENLSTLPDSISNLRNLTILTLDGNSSLSQLPDGIGKMDSLEILNIVGTPITSINIDELKSLPSLIFISADDVTKKNLTEEESQFLDDFEMR